MLDCINLFCNCGLHQLLLIVQERFRGEKDRADKERQEDNSCKDDGEENDVEEEWFATRDDIFKMFTKRIFNGEEHLGVINVKRIKEMLKQDHDDPSSRLFPLFMILGGIYADWLVCV